MSDLLTSTLRSQRKQVFTLALRFYLSVATLLIVLGFSWFYIDDSIHYKQQQEKQNNYIQSVSSSLHDYFFETLGDLLILSRKHYLFSDLNNQKDVLARMFVDVAYVRQDYDQIRLLDNSGMEVVRVNYRDNQAIVIADDELQDKSHRYYFQQAITLKQGEIYVSRMDLNVEKGSIEKPYKPMIRLATPVFDLQGRQKGMLVMNLIASKLLKVLQYRDADDESRLMLLNKEGYWLYSDTPSQLWGFQLPHKQRFTDIYPDAWLKLRNATSGQVRAEQGLFTHSKIPFLYDMHAPLVEQQKLPAGHRLVLQESEWYLVSMLDDEHLSTLSQFHNKLIFWAGFVFLLLLAPIAYWWAKRQLLNAYNEERIKTFSNIIENNDELIYVVDCEGKILFVNQAFERCTGYAANEVLGKTPSILKSGRHADDFYKLLWETITTGKQFEGLFINRKKDGSLFPEEKKIIPYFSDVGEIIYFVSIGHDMTSQFSKNLHEMQITSQISKSISHHINNLMNNIKGFIQLSISEVDGRKDNDKLRDYLQISVNSAAKVESLIAKIALTSHENRQDLPAVDIEDVTQEVLQEVGDDLSPNISLSLIADEHLPKVLASPDLIRLALKEVLLNASEALPGEGYISIEIRLVEPIGETCFNCGEPIVGKHVAISVIDNGKGINPDALERVFDPFFTDKESGKLVAITPGLGLTVVRGIVHSHAGHLTLESSPEHGTRLTILLPVSDTKP